MKRKAPTLEKQISTDKQKHKGMIAIGGKSIGEGIGESIGENFGESIGESISESMGMSMAKRPVLSVAPMMEWTTHHFRQLMRV
jgi:hypothetical protein